MKPHELIRLRKQLKLSQADVAQGVLNIPQSTYARYEDGSATVPGAVVEKMLQFQMKDRQWKKDLRKRIDADLKVKFPFGIVSSVIAD